MRLQWPPAVDVHHVDDQPLCRAQRRSRGLRQEQRRAQVRADEIVELRVRDRADRCRVERGRVVDQHVEPAEAPERGLDQRRQAIGVVQVGADRQRGACARSLEFRDQFVGRRTRPMVMNDDAGACCVQLASDGGAEALGAAGDEHAAAGERQVRLHDVQTVRWRRGCGVTIPDLVRAVAAAGFAA